MNALLFWLSAGLATLWTLLAACWWVIENAGYKSTWVNKPADCSDKLLWLGCPVSTPAFTARVEALQEILMKSPLKCIVLSGNEEEVQECKQRLQVPQDVQIELDTNGLRTFASIANLPPSSQATTIISHEFHLKRAVLSPPGWENRFSSSRLVSHSAHGPPNPAGEAFARLRAVTDRFFPPNEPSTKRKQS